MGGYNARGTRREDILIRVMATLDMGFEVRLQLQVIRDREC